jgi:hypothetical protein
MLPLISQLLVSELSLLLVEWLFPNKKKQQKSRQMMILVNVSYQLYPSVFKTYHRNQRR